MEKSALEETNPPRPGEKPKSEKPLGALLLESGMIDPAGLRRVLERQKGTGGRLGRLLVSDNLISEGDLGEKLSIQTGLPFIDLRQRLPDPEAVLMIPESVARKNRALAVFYKDRVLTVVMEDPMNYEAVCDIGFSAGMRIQPAIGIPGDILEASDRYYGGGPEGVRKTGAKRFGKDKNGLEGINGYPRVKVDGETGFGGGAHPVIQLSGRILEEAIRRNASDIHVEPGPKELLVRLRVDGLLQEYLHLPSKMHGHLVSRLKILGNMDIAERRLPQDGAVRIRMADRNVDLRASTLPTVYGEKMVFRVLDQDRTDIHLNSLGMDPLCLENIRSLIAVRKGIILVTGPTGSGKTTTLYALLKELRDTSVNLVSVEDPVEYQIEGVTQVQINTEIGLTFAGCLRSILRQDPNIILIGEIRDLETAEIAFRAAMTGHLVLSTLHTNDSISTLSRLIDLGVPRYLAGSLLVGVVAQRLVRRVCRRCGSKAPAVGEKRESCHTCFGSGFKGRVGVYEILKMNTRIKELVLKGASDAGIRSAASSSGFISLVGDGMKKVREGLTTPEEVWREVDVLEEGMVPCPGCRRSIPEEFLACPYCGETISSSCGKCAKVIQPDWSYCPFCRNPGK